MSLLLDALKKAADDKQKISRAESSSSQSVRSKEKSVKSAGRNEVQHLTDELYLQPKADQQVSPETLSVNEIESLAGLTFDIEEDSSDLYAAANNDIDNDSITKNAAALEEHKRLKQEELKQEKIDKDHSNDDSSDNGKITISDDALSMLIHKTNRDANKSKIMLIASVFIASLVILVSGGVYYYTDTKAEIAAIERKHQIAMQSMRSKTSREKTAEELEIIRSLVSDTELDEKVQYVKEHIASKKNSGSRSTQVPPKTGTKSAKPALSINKNKKTDPLGEKLDAAWLAYESGDYSEAKKSYKEVLNAEENNRDALLGLGAIAVVEKDSVLARKIYLSLLKLDPRDSIATAALASLRSEKSSLESDKEYLLSMLNKNPDAPHLNFSLANIYAQQNKWKTAQQYYFYAWQYDNDNADYIFNLAVSMDQLNKQQQAIKFYKDSLDKAINKQVSFSREAVQKRIKELSEL
jgi:tetratricopeptide (TPR) repeat protein